MALSVGLLPPTTALSFHAPLAPKSFPTSNQENEKEEDALSGSSSAPDWTTTDEDDEEMSSNEEGAEDCKEISSENKTEEVDIAKEETPSMDEVVKEDDTGDTSSENSDLEDLLRPCSKSKVVKDATLEYVLPRTREEGVLAYNESVKRFKKCQPTLESWRLSWPDVIQTGRAWLNVYGYHDKDKGHGGYGVILRNSLVRPIIAATWFSQVGGSQLFQVLSGIKTGLDLAVKYGYLRVSVCCNAQKAVELLGSSTFRTAGTCHLRDRSIHKVKTGGICRACTRRRLSVRGSSLEILIPVIKDLKAVQAKFDESKFRLTKVFRDQNEPAHYLARSAEGNAVEAPKEIKPADFPHKLGEYLWNDAFDCDTMYSLYYWSRNL